MSVGGAGTEIGDGDAAEAKNPLNCLVYVPNIYNGGGTTQSLVWIVEQFERAGIRVTLCFERSWQFPRKVRSISLFPAFLRRLPGRSTGLVPKHFLERAFLNQLLRHSPRDTFVYIWPQPRLALIKAIKACGFCVFREMINCPGQVCATEVREARYHAGLPDWQVSADQAIAEECHHLQLSDFITAPNAEVERSLVALDFPRRKIISTSFGWASNRFSGLSPAAAAAGSSDASVERPFTTLFVGHIGARKGVHHLFEAWTDLPFAMRLTLVGTVDPEMAPFLERALQDPRIVHIPFTSDLEHIFRSADVFAFPTVEEGGPQVTYEAAGCGLPVVTTPMGAARLIEDGRNGLIIPPHETTALRVALLDLFEHPHKREVLATQAALDAQAFTYEKVGASRAMLFRQKFSDYLRTLPD